MPGGILAAAQYWKILHPGGSLNVDSSRAGFSAEESPGVYEFQANYTPESISSVDQHALAAAGIKLNTQKLQSSRMTFVRAARR